MTDLKFYKFCEKQGYDIQGELEGNCMLFVSPSAISEFTDFLNKEHIITSENVLDCCYCDGHFVFTMKDICDMFDFEIENFLTTK